MRALRAALSVEDQPPGSPVAGETVAGEVVAALADAAEHGRRLGLRYRSPSGEDTERDVDPYGVVWLGRRWYLVALCHLRADLRTFRLDRICGLEPRAATFVPPLDVDCAEHVRRSIAAAGLWPVEVLLGMPLAEVRRRLPRIHAELEAHPEGVVVRVRVDDLDALARSLVGLGCPFKVHRPPELRAALRRLAAAIAQSAGAE